MSACYCHRPDRNCEKCHQRGTYGGGTYSACDIYGHQWVKKTKRLSRYLWARYRECKRCGLAEGYPEDLKAYETHWEAAQ